jgi:hypothetical protein
MFHAGPFLPLEVHQWTKANIKKHILYAVKTSYTVVQLLISGLDIIQVRVRSHVDYSITISKCIRPSSQIIDEYEQL